MVLLSLVPVLFGAFCRQARGQAAPAGQPAAPAAGTAAEPPAYRELQVDKSESGNGGKVRAMLRRGTFADQQQQMFDAYYCRYALAQWSLVQKRTELTRLRNELRRDFRNGKNGAVYTHLNNRALNFLAVLAKPNPVQQDFEEDIRGLVQFEASPAVGSFHPATRVNAMLMIGHLNAEEPDTFGKPAEPFPPALDTLLNAIADPQQIDAVKVAALIGIARHARFGNITDPALRDRLRAAMLAVANSKGTAGSAGTVRVWMRAQAADVLGELKVADGPVTAALSGMVADSALRLPARCAAAKALGRLSYQSGDGLDVSVLVAGLRKLTLEACAAEWQAAEISRRRLKARLEAVSAGLTGPDGTTGLGLLATEPPDQAVVAGLKQSLETMLKLVEETETTANEELKNKINAELGKLRAAPTKRPGE